MSEIRPWRPSVIGPLTGMPIRDIGGRLLRKSRLRKKFYKYNHSWLVQNTENAHEHAERMGWKTPVW